MTPDDLIAAVAAPIGSIGSSFYFAPETLAAGKDLGLDGFRFYVLGRGGVLGDVESPVVNAAFGYFSPALVAKLWDSAKDKVAPRVAGRRYHELCAEHGRRKFAGLSGLEAYCAAGEKVIAAADRDGLSLFAAIAAEPLVDDAPGRALQVTAVLRELRGSAHLVAVVASGLRARTAHFIKRPDDLKSFGYGPEDAVIGGDDAAKLEAAEKITDLIVRPAFAVLEPGDAAALVAGVQAMQAALG